MFEPSTPLNFAAIPRPAFGKAAQHDSGNPTPIKTKGLARYQRAAKTAAELLPELPVIGEAVHALMIGRYDLMQVITAVLPRLPACRHLRIATLCFSKRNTAELLGLVECRPTMRLTLLVSSFFKAQNKEMYETFAEELQDYPNAIMAAARSHAKIVCFDIGPDDGMVFEGSANLRANGNREQLTVIRDRSLHDWHSEWIDQVSTNGQEKE